MEIWFLLHDMSKMIWLEVKVQTSSQMNWLLDFDSEQSEKSLIVERSNTTKM